MSQDTPPRRGRPPSAKARAKALAAAREILLTEGFGRLTIEAVAAASGTGKPTIYRHWANAQELAMEALVADAPTPDAPEGDPLAALEAQLTRLTEAFATTRGRQITLALASADPDSEFTRAFRNRVILTARAAGRSLIEDGIATGRFAAPADIETLLDMIYGPLFFRLLAGHAPLTPDMARAITRTVGSALSPSA